MRPLDPLTIPCHGVRLIEASAGTGKTWTIATLYLRLLLEQRRSVREILVVTFTVAATEELRDRIRRRLRDAVDVLRGGPCDEPLLQQLLARQSDPAAAAQALADEITLLDEASIFTIHGFCQRMLQESAFESGALFDSEFTTSDAELRRAAIQDFWRRHFYAAGAGMARLARESWGTPDGLYAFLRPYLANPDLRVIPEVDPRTVDGATYLRLREALIALWVEEGGEILALIEESRDLSRNAKGGYSADNVAAAVAALEGWIAAEPEEYALPAGFQLFTQSHLHGAVTEAKRRKGIGGPLHPFFAGCEELAALCRRRLFQLTAEAIRFCREEVRRRKRERGLLSFDDLLSHLDEALAGEGGELLAERIARRYPIALVDEFQDTDPQQYRIFRRLYGGREEGALFMIGDPKQAIYSFRGADLYAYIGAKRETDPDGGRFTLDTNWRSASKLVAGVNALFTHPAPFLCGDDIGFDPVRPSPRADDEPLTIDGAAPAPLRVWFVPGNEENLHRGVIPKSWAKPHLARACAAEVARLVELGRAGRARIGDKPLAPRHIALLVRTHDEGQTLQEALRAAGVASVIQGRDSVFAGEEAREMLRLLLALAEPGEEGRLRALLATSLLGMTAAEIDALYRDELAWEGRMEELLAFHQQWLSRGFMPMFRGLLHAWGIPGRLLSLPDGERRMTNLLQLAELLQLASRDQPGVEQLLRWYLEQCRAPDGESEEQQLRLESDEALVQIVTVHKSKGLEYPVVLLPFPWATRRRDAKGPAVCHDEAGRPLLDLGSELHSHHHRRAEEERLAEDLRLLYVALTRAKHLCYLTWGRFTDYDASALGWLLHGAGLTAADDLPERLKGLDDAGLQAGVEAWAERAPGCIAVEPLPQGEWLRLAAGGAPGSTLQARLPARRVESQWRVTSYTALTAGLDHQRPDYGSLAEESEGESIASKGHILHFPRGARAGTFFHKLLERCDFPQARGDLLMKEVERQLQRHGFASEWQGAVAMLVGNLLDTPLNGAALCLRGVEGSRKLVELEFFYPLARFSAGELERLVAGLGGYAGEGPALRFDPCAGVMRGFIDLIFEYQGRFFIVDYKSNFLGSNPGDYRRERLAAAMAVNRYDLQSLIYCVALHRYLKRRIAGYRYERHFGGSYYLFLRGMDRARGAESGVYFQRPEEGLIAALDRLFERGAR